MVKFAALMFAGAAAWVALILVSRSTSPDVAFIVGWFGAYVYCVRDALLWTIAIYKRDNLGWDSADTWIHVLTFGALLIFVWPLWVLFRLCRWAWSKTPATDPVYRWAERQYERAPQ